jgi:hypothetical protein
MGDGRWEMGDGCSLGVSGILYVALCMQQCVGADARALGYRPRGSLCPSMRPSIVFIRDSLKSLIGRMCSLGVSGLACALALCTLSATPSRLSIRSLS